MSEGKPIKIEDMKELINGLTDTKSPPFTRTKRKKHKKKRTLVSKKRRKVS